ncbi:conserved hypothetical protein [Tenacibaculum sp. 190524A05c]|uniref:hypothetical protein n=1 Tax=Tenacibaculum platacis TaxID=3137852 RepID=UPI0031FB026B
MTLQEIINKSSKGDTIQFTLRSNRFRSEKNLIVIDVVGHKVMSRDYTGNIHFNRLDFEPLRYVYNPLPF